ncbi:MAG: tRNA 2-thiouridine(34) synthase MnmA [Parachlamydiaceae bacterium]|nr:tRNA 2-thiouridine(34) synthase MnmA [Parachlamydiaceae bacterium]
MNNVKTDSKSNSETTVVVGMSGGVDSSVCALLLKQQGYRVIGLFMKNWEEQDEHGVCQASKEYADVVRVCGQIGIPYYSVNFIKEYQENVFSHFVEEFKKGYTPNPDILCNREIKFKVLLQKAIELGGDFLATGHYCQVGGHVDSMKLLKGADPGKDQSYFLYAINGQALSKVMFPIGHMLKSELREIARQNGLATSEKKDSTGICFIGKRDFKQFLGQYIQYKAGNFENLKGEVVGQHDGAAFYTPGQRRGMGIGGAGEAWFVVGKDVERNVVFVDQGILHPALFCDTVIATDLTWISGVAPSLFPFRCRSKVRYRQPDQHCVIEKIVDGKVVVAFDVPQRAVTPRQSIVFYDGDVCLGGGMIESPGPSYHVQGRELPSVVSP